METDDITDFLPKYPFLNDIVAGKFAPYKNESFNQVILQKAEFYENKLDKFETVPLISGEYIKHQETIIRFMSSYTPYDRLLLMHQMGTGKTCATIGAIENIRKETRAFTGAIIVAKGNNLLNNFRTELMFKCTKGEYIPEDYKTLTTREKVVRSNKLIGEFYHLITMKVFAKQLKKDSDTTIISRYSNKIIVIDEIHNIREHEDVKESVNTYNQFLRLSQLVKNTKILLLSGTPMKDTPEELASVLNLLLPQKDALPTDSEFMKRYFDKNTLIHTNELKKKITGRVSYVKSMTDPRVIKKIEGTVSANRFNVVEDNMGIFQTTAYKQAYKKDTTENKSMYNNSRQASLFVFPNGTYGEEGFKQYIKSKRNSYTINNEFIQALVGKTNDETLKKIAIHSSKYAAAIKNILKTKGQKSFIYCEYIKGSGLIVFTKLLELLGYSPANGGEKTEGLRYALITSETTSTAKIIKRFNKLDNVSGKFIQLVIGSAAISEGFSLTNIQNIDVLTPHWNYAETEQAIARGYRLGSHADLLKTKKNIILHVYHRVSIPKNVKSIDIHLYETAYDKDIKIKQIERLIMENAIDCSLNYNRNHNDGSKNGSRECEYTDCKYTCSGIKQIDDNDLDYSTYNIYYNKKIVHHLSLEIIEMFKENFSLHYDEILKRLSGKYTTFIVLTTLKKLINENETIQNKYGFPMYLREEKNVYFLSMYLTGKVSYESLYYTEKIITTKVSDFSDVINRVYNKVVPEIINKLCSSTNSNYIIQELENIFEPETKQYLIEMAIIAKDKGKSTIFIDTVLSYYEKIYNKINDTIVCSYMNGLDDSHPLRCYDKTKKWNNCSEDMTQTFADEFKKEFKKMGQNEFQGYYGTQSHPTGTPNRKFCIVSPTKEEDWVKGNKISSGRNCLSWKKPALIDLIHNNFKIPISTSTISSFVKNKFDGIIPDKKSLVALIEPKYKNVAKLPYKELVKIHYLLKLQAKDLCNIIDKFLTNKNFVINDMECGKQGKKTTKRANKEKAKPKASIKRRNRNKKI